MNTSTSWHTLSVGDALRELGADPVQGLSSAEAQKRLETFGPNELRLEKKTSPWRVLLGQFKNVLIIILLVATALSVLVGELFDAALILAIVIFSAVLGFFQEYRAERALEALKKMLSPMISVLRNGKEDELPSKDLVPGDILLLEAGDKIPADARLVEAVSLKCDEAPLTGESLPVNKDTAPMPGHVGVSDRRNMVFTGSTVSYGRGKAVVAETGLHTEFGQIAEQVAAVKAKETPLEKRTKEIGKWLGIIAFGICFLIGGVSLVRAALEGRPIDLDFIITIIMFAVALAVAAVPEALAAIVTGSLAIGMHQMAKRHALVRKMPAVETLGCTTVICSDKTGTLTKGEMTVRNIYAAGRMLEVTGVGYAPHGEVRHEGRTVVPGSDPVLQGMLQAGVLCSDASLEEVDGQWRIKGDPTEGALVVAAVKHALKPTEIKLENQRLEELPFSSERKRMTTIHPAPAGGKLAITKGAPEIVLGLCAKIRDNQGTRPLQESDRRTILAVNEGMAKSALRVLAVAVRELSETEHADEETLERDLTFLGFYGMLDPPREEAIEAIRVCREVKIKPVMITGDHVLTAMAVARETGIYREGDLALTGPDLERMTEEDLERIVDKVTVYARVAPLDKLKIVNAWKKRGEIVAMTGDGVNDAPALKQADIGIAMGITGTDVSKEAADMILNDDNFATIVKAIERGRWIYDNIKKYLTFLLRCNITEVIVIGGAVLALGPNYLPLLPAAILFLNLATDGLPALALGIAPPDPDIMKRPPRSPKESIFSRDVLIFVGLAILIESPFFLYIFFHDLGHITQARTEIFFLFIIVELIIALHFRSLRFSVFKLPPHGWLIWAVLSQFVLAFAILLIPSIRESFGVELPALGTLAFILGFGLVISAVMEATKAFLRRRDRRNTGL